MVSQSSTDEHEQFTQESDISVYFTQSEQNIGIAMLVPNQDLTTCEQKPFCIKIVDVCETNHFSNLESILLQINPSTCFCTGKLDSGKGLIFKKLLDKLEISCSVLKSKSFASESLEDDLLSLLNIDSLIMYQSYLAQTLSMKALSGLIAGLHLAEDEEKKGHILLSNYDISLYMKLDKSALQTMNIFPVNQRENKHSSLYGLLNNTVTNGMGERLLERWLRHPLCDLDEIKFRLNITNIFVDNPDMRDTIRNESLKGMVDIDKYCKKLEKKNCKLQDLYHLLQALTKLDTIIETCSSYKGDNYELVENRFIQPLEQIRTSLNGFRQLMNETLDTSGLNNTPPEFLIKPSWSNELRDIMNCRNEIHNQIAKLYETDLNSWGNSMDLKCEMNSRFGYVYRCSAKYEKELRSKHDLFILSVLKSGILFTSQGVGGLKDLSDNYIDYKSQYQQYQEQLVQKVIEVASTYVSPFYLLSSYISQLDVLSSYAYLVISSALPYSKPQLTGLDGSEIIIENARHPLLEVQDGVNFIPNNYHFDREKNRFIVITGPNMGGKSTYIRELGILILLSQIGCYVPAEHATLCLFKNIYARVGAGDIQLKGVSTFMSEMIEASIILQESNPHTFVMIDELGRGTSTYDGLGLSWSIAEYIITKLKCFCLFATHFQELIKLDTIKGVQNLHVTAITNDNSITMLYEVKQGGCDQSFGIHCAELAHFPKSIIDDAKVKVEEFEGNTTIKKQKLNENESIEKQLECLYQSLLLLPSEEEDTNVTKEYNSIMNKIATLINSS